MSRNLRDAVVAYRATEPLPLPTTADGAVRRWRLRRAAQAATAGVSVATLLVAGLLALPRTSQERLLPATPPTVATTAPALDPAVRTLVTWMAAHPDDYGLDVLRDGMPVLARGAGTLLPLASTRKVLVLEAYAAAVEAGTIDPAAPVPTADVERWYAPGLDGGAHPAAEQEAAAKGWVVGGATTTDHLAWAMTRWSDDAAADYLLARVGGSPAVVDAAYAARFEQPQGTYPFLGEIAAWSADPAGWLAADPAGRTAAADAAAAALVAHPGPQGLTPPSVTVQRQLSEASVPGSAADYAALLDGVATDQTHQGDLLRKYLAWPLTEVPGNGAAYDEFLAKGGSLPGVRTNVLTVVPKGSGTRTTAALFLRNLPADLDEALTSSFADQQLLLSLTRAPGLGALGAALPGAGVGSCPPGDGRDVTAQLTATSPSPTVALQVGDSLTVTVAQLVLYGGSSAGPTQRATTVPAEHGGSSLCQVSADSGVVVLRAVAPGATHLSAQDSGVTRGLAVFSYGLDVTVT